VAAADESTAAKCALIFFLFFLVEPQILGIDAEVDVLAWRLRSR
jgi:hypothetical protein